MRRKNYGRWKWLLVKQEDQMFGIHNPLHEPPKYKVVKTGASRYDGAYAYWEIVGEYDDPRQARAMLALVQASN